MRLDDFSALTFDCYGTLIDWESGMLAALRPWFLEKRPELTDDALLEAYGRVEHSLELAHPAMLYSELLRRVHHGLSAAFRLAPDEAAARRFAGSIAQWPPFPDTVAALQYLKGHYKLVILSNVDRISFGFSNQKLGVTFDAIVTAQDVGSYKPDPRNFQHLIKTMAEIGVPKGKILHTAQSLFHDHVPAKAIGLASAWINRRHAKIGGGATPAALPVKPDFVFASMADFVAAHRALSA
ncbi:MAG: haloacid dehalogenase type II [Alphaproteobacteria bacterium]|nr:haloacid dehalogenase type II [Alphaproteobacteria bacterium]